MGPLRGDGNCTNLFCTKVLYRVEKMGPLRGDGNTLQTPYLSQVQVEKMGPLRGDGNVLNFVHFKFLLNCREDGSPSWGRKLYSSNS